MSNETQQSRNPEVILVTGSNSLLGQHIVKHLQLYWDNLSEIRSLDLEKPFENRLKYEEKVKVKSFVGSLTNRKWLEEVLKGTDTVIHLLEHLDFSMLPESNKMWNLNLKGTEVLLSVCESIGVKKFIYGSTMFVMASKYWPSVYNPEITPLPKSTEYLFPDYCNSKLAAEKCVEKSDKMQTFIVRLSFLYGEGDTESEMHRAILTAKTNGGILQRIGDGGGVVQYTYAGNVAWGVIYILKKMASDPSVSREVVFLLDSTPCQGFYALLEPFLKARKFRFSESAVSWFVAYLPYAALESVMGICQKIVDVRQYLHNLPSSNYLYAHYYFWYFFSWFKARCFLDYAPLYSYEKAVQNSESYYSTL